MVGEYWSHQWGVNTPIGVQFPCLNLDGEVFDSGVEAHEADLPDADTPPPTNLDGEIFDVGVKAHEADLPDADTPPYARFKMFITFLHLMFIIFLHLMFMWNFYCHIIFSLFLAAILGGTYSRVFS